MNLLCWIAVLPAAFIAGVASAIVAHEISRRTTLLKIVTGLIAGAIFVATGALMAPSHRAQTIVGLAVINAIYALSQARTLLLAPGERVDWLSLSRVFGGLAVFYPLWWTV